jgi:hypothetical protein
MRNLAAQQPNNRLSMNVTPAKIPSLNGYGYGGWFFLPIASSHEYTIKRVVLGMIVQKSLDGSGSARLFPVELQGKTYI